MVNFLRQVDDFSKETLREKIKKGERPVVVCGFTSYYNDDEKVICSKCGRSVFIRPFNKKTVDQYGLLIVCIKCALL